MDQITLPILDWFVGEPFRKTGNRYAGSVGATSLSANAFCYLAWLERGDDGVFLKADVCDVLSKGDPSLHTTASFAGNQAGWEELRDWLGAKYQTYLDQKRNELVVDFNRKED